MIDAFEKAPRLVIFGTRFDANGALRNGREHLLDGNNRGDLVLKLQAIEAGRGEDGRIGQTIGEFIQSRFDVAAKLHHLEIGPQPQELGLAADRRSAHSGTLWKVEDRLSLVRQKRITRILAG